MPTQLTDADKVLRNDTGKDIVEKLDDIAQALGIGAPASNVTYDNTESGLTADDVQEAIDELSDEKVDKSELTLTTTPDTTPYLYKASEYDAVYDKLVGGTVAWNQYALSIASDNYAGVVSTLTIQDSVATVSNPTARYSSIKTNKTQSNWVNNHRYLVILDFKANFTFSNVNNFGMYVTGGGKQFGGGFVYSTADVWQNVYVFVQPTSGVGNDMRLQTQDNSTEYSGHEHSIRNLMCFDLTQMFGSTIADYIYSLEQATAGAGVAWFRNLFPKSYYAYNAGILQSVKTSAHKMVGFNQWDEEWETGYYDINDGIPKISYTQIRSKNRIQVLPNTTYYIKSPSILWILQYDANDNYLGLYINRTNNTLTTSANTRYIRFYSSNAYGSVYNHDICINISDTTKNGTYEPYVKTEYTLNNNLELRGIPKLDTNNKLYYDGDEYTSDGNVTRKYAKVVFDGSISTNWQYSGEYGTSLRFNYIDNSIKPNSFNITSSRFPYHMVENNTEGISTHSQSSMIILEIAASKLNGVTVADLMTYFSSKPLTVVYELATPTTESSTPFANPQTVYSKGTEEYIDERAVAIPVGGDRTYVDIPDWLQNRYFDDVRSESSLVPEISNEVSHKAEQKDLTDIFVTGTKNNTGSTIAAGTYFYVNGQLALCKSAISANADLTLNTNYELVTAGALNKLASDVDFTMANNMIDFGQRTKIIKSSHFIIATLSLRFPDPFTFGNADTKVVNFTTSLGIGDALKNTSAVTSRATGLTIVLKNDGIYLGGLLGAGCTVNEILPLSVAFAF